MENQKKSEINMKVLVDTQQIDDAITRVNQLADALEKAEARAHGRISLDVMMELKESDMGISADEVVKKLHSEFSSAINDYAKPEAEDTMILKPICTEEEIKDALQKEMAILLERSMRNDLCGTDLAKCANAMISIADALLPKSW